MMRAPACATACLVACVMVTTTGAHPPDSDGHHAEVGGSHADPETMRRWTNQKSGEVVRGAFLAARRVEGVMKVSIERENGDVVSFALTDLSDDDRIEAQRRIDEARAINEGLVAAAHEGNQNSARPGTEAGAAPAKPAQAAPFDTFAPFVRTRWDDRWLYVESDGLPHEPWSYPLMVGIRSWQQQVPLPQAYTGSNAWQIPLKPELADKPISGKTQLYRGAIALAANGVPIFNALNNRGDDTFKVGELDDYGGHAGRGDDYHYHIAPLALQRAVGKGNPIAYALDGFPLYGLFDAKARQGEDRSCPLRGIDGLDELNGHFGTNADGSKGLYHYHASIAYPYINGGMRGKVTVKDDQIDPQPQANPVRQWLQPLRGASISGFRTLTEKSWSLEYTLSGKKHLVNFRIEDGGKYVFDFSAPDGTTKTETYTGRPNRDRPARGRAPQRGDSPEDQTTHARTVTSDFRLTSSAVGVDGALPAEFTCDGAGIFPPLAWAKPPAGTTSFAVTMHHIPGPPRPGDAPGEDKHVYLVLYNISDATTSLEKGLTRVSGGPAAPWEWGINTVNRRAEYAPPCSKGPGAKKYTLTVYALSKKVTLTPADSRGATMDELLTAIKDSTLGTASLDVTYTRTGK